MYFLTFVNKLVTQFINLLFNIFTPLNNKYIKHHVIMYLIMSHSNNMQI